MLATALPNSALNSFMCKLRDEVGWYHFWLKDFSLANLKSAAGQTVKPPSLSEALHLRLDILTYSSASLYIP